MKTSWFQELFRMVWWFVEVIFLIVKTHG